MSTCTSAASSTPSCTCSTRGLWHKILFDLGHLSSSEPFRRLFNQGYIQAAAFTDERGFHVEASEVVERDGSVLPRRHRGHP